MTLIRPAGTADREPIARLLARCGLPADDIDEGRVEFLAAMVEEKLVGTVGLESYPPLGLLRSAAVDPLMQGRGIGRQMVVALAAHARRKGLGRLVLLTTTAEKFFRDAGFHAIDRGTLDGPILGSGQFSGSRCASAVVMAMNIAGLPAAEGPRAVPPVS